MLWTNGSPNAKNVDRILRICQPELYIWLHNWVSEIISQYIPGFLYLDKGELFSAIKQRISLAEMTSTKAERGALLYQT